MMMKVRVMMRLVMVMQLGRKMMRIEMIRGSIQLTTGNVWEGGIQRNISWIRTDSCPRPFFLSLGHEVGRFQVRILRRDSCRRRWYRVVGQVDCGSWRHNYSCLSSDDCTIGQEIRMMTGGNTFGGILSVLRGRRRQRRGRWSLLMLLLSWYWTWRRVCIESRMRVRQWMMRVMMRMMISILTQVSSIRSRRSSRTITRVVGCLTWVVVWRHVSNANRSRVGSIKSSRTRLSITRRQRIYKLIRTHLLGWRPRHFT